MGKKELSVLRKMTRKSRFSQDFFKNVVLLRERDAVINPLKQGVFLHGEARDNDESIF
jgi:hypothetical protein